MTGLPPDRSNGARRHLAGLLLAIVAAVLAVFVSPVPAGAVGVGGPQAFGLTPSLAPNGQSRPYFQYTLRAGATIRDTAIISNAGTKPLRLEVSASTGVTAPNSGTAFTDYFGPCSGTGCWVTGLPSSVTLEPGQRKAVRFEVHVPAGTRPRQYLAGITVQPAASTAPVRVGGNGHAGARAVIVQQATVGVAVTVGLRAKLTTSLSVATVTAGYIQSLPRLAVHLDNTGQTFTHADGTMRCAGTSRSYRVIAQTVLPDDQAAVPVNAPGLPAGRPVACRIRLHYDGHLLTWSGTITLPRSSHPPTVQTGPGAYSTLRNHGLPAWAIAVITVLGAALLALGFLSLRLARRQRRARS